QYIVMAKEDKERYDNELKVYLEGTKDVALPEAPKSVEASDKPSIYVHDPIDINGNGNILFQAVDPKLLVVMPRERRAQFEQKLAEFVAEQAKEMRKANVKKVDELFIKRGDKCIALAKELGGEVLPITSQKCKLGFRNIDYVQKMSERIARKAPIAKLHSETSNLETKKKVEEKTGKVLALSNKILRAVTEGSDVPWVKDFIPNQYMYPPNSLSPEYALVLGNVPKKHLHTPKIPIPTLAQAGPCGGVSQGNDLIAHDPSHGGCARMQTMHEDWVFFATNQTANMHCNIHPDDDGDDAFDNRRDEEDVTNNPLLGFTGIRIVTYSLKAIDKGLVLARLEEERMRTKKKEAREAEEEEQDGKKGNGFVWTLLKKLLMFDKKHCNDEGTSPEQTRVFTDRLIEELRKVDKDRVETLLQAGGEGRGGEEV
ncbi:hypothetical protein TrRE_jg3500, partial [Triparma retinervis]